MRGFRVNSHFMAYDNPQYIKSSIPSIKTTNINHLGRGWKLSYRIWRFGMVWRDPLRQFFLSPAALTIGTAKVTRILTSGPSRSWLKAAFKQYVDEFPFHYYHLLPNSLMIWCTLFLMLNFLVISSIASWNFPQLVRWFSQFVPRSRGWGFPSYVRGCCTELHHPKSLELVWANEPGIFENNTQKKTSKCPRNFRIPVTFIDIRVLSMMNHQQSQLMWGHQVMWAGKPSSIWVSENWLPLNLGLMISFPIHHSKSIGEWSFSHMFPI
jgi:hypothetical protein